MTKEGSAAAAVKLAEDAFGGLDIRVSNAGVGFMGAVEKATPAECRPMFETNVFGLIEATRAGLPSLRQRRGARVVNFSSDAGIALYVIADQVLDAAPDRPSRDRQNQGACCAGFRNGARKSMPPTTAVSIPIAAWQSPDTSRNVPTTMGPAAATT